MLFGRVRVVALFALRYEREGGRHIDSLMQRLHALGVPRGQVNGLECLLNFAGSSHRVGDLYSDRTFRSRFVTMAKQVAGLRVRLHGLSAPCIALLQAGSLHLSCPCKPAELGSSELWVGQGLRLLGHACRELRTCTRSMCPCW